MRLKKTGVPDVKIRLYYQNNKAEMAGPQHLNLCLSAHPLYLWHCPNMGVPVFNWLCLSDLPPMIYYHTWSFLIVASIFISPFFLKDNQLPSKHQVSSLPSTKDLDSVKKTYIKRRHTSKLLTDVCHILGRQPKFIGLFKFTDTLQYCPIDWNTFNILIRL